ncbi:type VI secretion system protein TssA [Neptuniibacter sp. PT34_22]|uniref:type VI secretion system protein TssA n=1 Tax=Neptuniibacter sp. PT34_22 TaxID=3398205 RepID=UPI0039F5E76F
MDQQEILSLALPLEGGSPVGPDVKHDDDFTRLEDELRKGEGIDIQPIDWPVVEIVSGKILKEQSKDLRVASRLVAALFYRHSFKGLNAGFKLLRDLVNAPYWDDIHPKRPKSRGAAVSWTLQKIDRPFSEFETTLEQATDVIEAANVFVELDNALAEKLGDKAPSLFEFRNVIGRYKQEAEYLIAEEEKKKAAPAPAPVEAEPQPEAHVASQTKPAVEANPAASQTAPVQQQKQEQAQQTVKAPTHVAVAVSSAEDIAKALRSCNSTMSKVAHLVRGQKVSDPYAYYLLRTGIWMQLREVPADGVLPAPMGNKLAALLQLEQNKDWPSLIEECEKTFASGQIFWLSLHRMVANALDAMGAKEAAQAVKDSVAMLVSRLPEILTRTFDGGEGFADEMTKAWIASLSTQSNETTASDSGVTQESFPWQSVAAEAKKHAINSEFDQGLALFKQGILSVSSLREQAYWQLEQARFCYDAGHLEIAQPQLTYLHQMIEEKQLQQWEPLLHLEVTKLLVNCHSQAQTKKKYTTEQLTQVDQLKAHLCLMDPLGALSILKTN